MRNKPHDRRLADLAARQHGVVTLAQLRAAGIDRHAAARRARGGTLHRLHRGVYAVGHPRVGPHGRCLAAALACGEKAAVSHGSAAYLWGLLPSLLVPIDVTVPGITGRPSRRGIRVHSSLLLDRASVARRGCIPVTNVERTLRDLMSTAERDLYLRAARRAIDLRLAEPNDTSADELTRSELERRFLALCRRHRLPAPEVNSRVGTHEVDFLWREQRVVAETDGFRFHGDRAAFEADRARDAALQSLGFAVLRFTYRQVLREPREVGATLRRVLAHPSSPLGSPSRHSA